MCYTQELVLIGLKAIATRTKLSSHAIYSRVLSRILNLGGEAIIDNTSVGGASRRGPSCMKCKNPFLDSTELKKS